jgi:hypothetical protein
VGSNFAAGPTMGGIAVKNEDGSLTRQIVVPQEMVKTLIFVVRRKIMITIF